MSKKVIDLSKNDTINLSKSDGTRYTKIRVGLGWTPADKYPSYDLDASVFVCKHVKQKNSYEQIGRASCRERV